MTQKNLIFTLSLLIFLFLGTTNSLAVENCSPSGTLSGVYTCSGSMNTYSTTTVESGKNATQISSQSISLKPGFWAKAGSAFTAKIDTTVDVDADSDGMLDVWEVLYFGSISQYPNGDYDGDGYTNLQEYLANTDPTDPNDKPANISRSSHYEYDELGRIKSITRDK